MRLFLKLKHWQLFTATWILPLIIGVTTIHKPQVLINFFPILMFIFTLSLFGWIWSITIGLNKKIPQDVNLNLTSFKIYFFISLIIIMTMIAWLASKIYGFSIGIKINILFLMLSQIIYMICVLLSISFAAKTIKSIELGRVVKFDDYIGDFFLIWFSPIGIWILQPRINKLIEN